MASTSTLKYCGLPSKAKKRPSALSMSAPILDITKKKRKVCKETNILLKIGLGNGKFLTVNNCNDQNYVDLRNYEGQYPTKRGIALCPIRTKTLLDIIDNIDQDAETSWITSTDERREFRVHLGYGTFLNIYEVRGKRFYDVRHWRKSEDSKEPVPTKSGLCMKAAEFHRFKEFLPTIEGLLPELISIRTCECWFLSDPNRTCDRCFPFVYEDE
jgi:hypothetical protein